MTTTNTPQGAAAALTGLDNILTHPALAGMRAIDQWVIYRLTDDAERPGKRKKTPHSAATGRPTSVSAPASWTDIYSAVEAALRLGADGVGFCFTEGCGLWFLDIDNAFDHAKREWSDTANALYSALPGAAVEISSSGKGLHLFGRGKVPPHSTKPSGRNIELYTSDRFCAMTGINLQGSCDVDLTAEISRVAANYFPPRATSRVELADDGPCSEWSGPEDDDALIELARRSRSAASVFGDGVSFDDLWTANAAALARKWPHSEKVYDPSGADFALAVRLAFWTGRDVARIERLMRRSALRRDKWETAPGYLVGRTITFACSQQKDVLGSKQQAPASEPTATDPAPTQAGAEPRYAVLPGDPFNTARAFLQRHFSHAEGQRLKAWQGTFYEWAAAHWREREPADMRARLYNFLDREGFSHYQPTQSKVNALADALKAAAHLDSAHSAPCWIGGEATAPATELVACANGLLHLPSRSMLLASPRFFNLNAVPFAFDPLAPPPTLWLQFLRTVWPIDPEAIDTLQELFGYLLTPNTSQQKVFLIVGPKRSGKGTIARVLSELLGPDNVAGPTLASMAETFGLHPLVGKLAAIISDARLSGRTDQKSVAENLLRISGEDRVEVGRKFLPAMTTRLGVRFVMLTNELPKIADASGAMASRFVILTMAESFLGREDPGLTSKLLSELQGILAWAVDGWHRLNTRGHFIEPKSSAGAAQELADLGSPIGAFVRDECRRGPEVEIEVRALFAAWRTWCAREGITHPGTAQVFGRDLRAAFPAITQARPRTGGDRVRVYRGIALSGPQWSAVHSIAA